MNGLAKVTTGVCSGARPEPLAGIVRIGGGFGLGLEIVTGPLSCLESVLFDEGAGLVGGDDDERPPGERQESLESGSDLIFLDVGADEDVVDRSLGPSVELSSLWL